MRRIVPAHRKVLMAKGILLNRIHKRPVAIRGGAILNIPNVVGNITNL